MVLSALMSPESSPMAAIRIASALACLCLIAGVPAAMAQGPVTAPPAAKTFRLGALRLTALRDGGYFTPAASGDFGLKAGAAAVADILRKAGQPTDKVVMNVGALLVRMPGHLVLIDTGLGPAGHGVLPQSLALVGVSPTQITDVLITHAHSDHVGGLLATGGRSAFPRATIWMSAREWDWMKGQAGAKAAVAAIAPQVSPFEPGHPILPGVTPIALYGHTPGHVGYEITSHGQMLEDIGDTAHSPILSLAEPNWTEGLDEDPDAAAAARVRELKRLAANHELVFAAHFPFPGIGRIEPNGQGFSWKPALLR
jgi:glyoxylase-like metal-dependent hydrolase (beta-lactamase superfamily II)